MKSSAGSRFGVGIRVATVVALVAAIVGSGAAIKSARNRDAALRILSKSHGVSVPALKVAFERGWSLNAARAADSLAQATHKVSGSRLTPELVKRAVSVADTTEVRPQANWAEQPQKREKALVPTDYSSAVTLANLKAAHLASESTENAAFLRGGRKPIGDFTRTEENRLRFWREAQNMLSNGEGHDLSKGVVELLKARGGAKIGAPLVTRDSLDPKLLDAIRRLPQSKSPSVPPKTIKPKGGGRDKGVAFNSRGPTRFVRRLPRG